MRFVSTIAIVAILAANAEAAPFSIALSGTIQETNFSGSGGLVFATDVTTDKFSVGSTFSILATVSEIDQHALIPSGFSGIAGGSSLFLGQKTGDPHGFSTITGVDQLNANAVGSFSVQVGSATFNDPLAELSAFTTPGAGAGGLDVLRGGDLLSFDGFQNPPTAFPGDTVLINSAPGFSGDQYGLTNFSFSLSSPGSVFQNTDFNTTDLQNFVQNYLSFGFGSTTLSFRNADLSGVLSVSALIDNVSLAATDNILIGGATSSAPILPPAGGSTGGGFSFGNVFVPNQNGIQFFDPEIAIGYTYETDGGSAFDAVVLPDIGDGRYDLLLLDEILGEYVDTQMDILAGETFVFDEAVTSFRIGGIEVDAALNPDDPLAFVTGLSFDQSGFVNFTQTPLTTNVGGDNELDIPEPPTTFLALLGGMALAGLSRRNHRARGQKGRSRRA